MEARRSLDGGTEEEEMCMFLIFVLRKQAWQCFPMSNCLFFSCDAKVSWRSSLHLSLIWTACLSHWATRSIPPHALHAHTHTHTHTHTHIHTYTIWEHNWEEMSVVFQSLFLFPRGALNNISACFCSPSILSHPVFPWSFYEHLLMQSFLLHLGLLLFHYAWWRD